MSKININSEIIMKTSKFQRGHIRALQGLGDEPKGPAGLGDGKEIG